MEPFKPLARFFAAIQKDGRISVTHIGVFAALVQHWQASGFPVPLQAYSHELMKVARILSRATYHTCVRDLHDFGYIRYEPSYKRNVRSRFYLYEE